VKARHPLLFILVAVASVLYKDDLLCVLEHPEIPLHSNASELGARLRKPKYKTVSLLGGYTTTNPDARVVHHQGCQARAGL
jgi:hypothetical protein